MVEFLCSWPSGSTAAWKLRSWRRYTLGSCLYSTCCTCCLVSHVSVATIQVLQFITDSCKVVWRLGTFQGVYKEKDSLGTFLRALNVRVGVEISRRPVLCPLGDVVERSVVGWAAGCEGGRDAKGEDGEDGGEMHDKVAVWLEVLWWT